MLYTSTNNNKIKELKKLEMKKYRDLTSTFLVVGEHLVNEAYKHNKLISIILLEGTQSDLDIDTDYANQAVMKHLSNQSNATIIGICKIVNNNKIGNRILILDGVQNPGNFGTIIRSCVAFNFDTIILSNNSVSLYNPKTIQATEGMLFNINIIYSDLEDVITKLKSDNYQIFGTNVINGTPLQEIEFDNKLAIIMGSEGSGISNEVSELIDNNIYIPINKNCESLNVGVAASIILYEVNNG